MKKITITNKQSNEVISLNGVFANTFITRAIGLMGKKNIPADFCLLIEPCKQIHMMNMRFSIDVIYLNADNRIIDIDTSIAPWSIGKKRPSACKVIESNAGYLSTLVKLNDYLVFKQVK